jgi:dienelactone hydrolase
MTRVITRPLKENEDGIPGYIAFPEREEKGPGLLLIHQHSGLTGYLKTAAYRFAQLGYTTVVPNLYQCWVIRRKRTSTRVRRFKTRHRIRIFSESSTAVGVIFARVTM